MQAYACQAVCMQTHAASPFCYCPNLDGRNVAGVVLPQVDGGCTKEQVNAHRQLRLGLAPSSLSCGLLAGAPQMHQQTSCWEPALAPS